MRSQNPLKILFSCWSGIVRELTCIAFTGDVAETLASGKRSSETYSISPTTVLAASSTMVSESRTKSGTVGASVGRLLRWRSCSMSFAAAAVATCTPSSACIRSSDPSFSRDVAGARRRETWKGIARGGCQASGRAACLECICIKAGHRASRGAPPLPPPRSRKKRMPPHPSQQEAGKHNQ
jgi:hypothetical protein